MSATALRIVPGTLVLLALTGCSYAYDLLAVVQNGNLVFIVDSASGRHPACLRQIEVLADRVSKTQPEPGDDVSRVGYGTYWFESVSYDDDCANEFPLPYGSPLKGRHMDERGIVKAKPLKREVVYDVVTTTGATGYGGGRFVIHTNGQVANLRPTRTTAN